jgi:hypothetical protein
MRSNKTIRRCFVMRMLKGLGAMLVVAAMVIGLAVAVTAKPAAPANGETSVSVNASFSIPSWISLSIVGHGDVSFDDITGPGSYDGSNKTQLRVLSTTSWSLSSAILWADSTLPSGASQSTLGKALALTFDQTSGSWGVHDVSVAYEIDLGVNDLANLPEGDYNLVIQYTATTD